MKTKVYQLNIRKIFHKPIDLIIIIVGLMWTEVRKPVNMYVYIKEGDMGGGGGPGKSDRVTTVEALQEKGIMATRRRYHQ